MTLREHLVAVMARSYFELHRDHASSPARAPVAALVLLEELAFFRVLAGR